MQRYGIALEQLAPHGQAAAQAAERIGARTLVYRGETPVAAIVPLADLEGTTQEPADAGVDPLLALCGTCACDGFADRIEEGYAPGITLPPR